MKKQVVIIGASIAVLVLASCGMKVINPNEPNNKGTMQLDMSDGTPRLVPTYTCKLESMGNRFYSVKKTEAEAREDVLGKCHSRTMLSFCKAENIKCEKN